KQLTLLVGFQTASAYAAFSAGDKALSDQTPSLSAGLVVSAISMIFTAVMWVMEVRSTLYRDAAIKAARSAWPHPRPRWLWINATTLVLALHVVLYGAWLAYAVLQSMSRLLTIVFAAGGVVLIVYSIFNYRELGKVSPE